MKTGVNIIIAGNQNTILILKRSSNVEFSPNLWDLPGGKVEDKESLKEAIKREAKEESGLDVEPEDNYFYVFYYPNEKVNVYAFRTKLIGGNIQLNEEHAEFKWISMDNWETFDYTPSVSATLKEFFK